MSFAGYVTVCCLLTNNKEKASRQTYTQETTTKLTKKNSTEKHKWKRSECDHVRKKGKKPAKQIPSGIWK
jgi:hypothetical protein